MAFSNSVHQSHGVRPGEMQCSHLSRWAQRLCEKAGQEMQRNSKQGLRNLLGWEEVSPQLAMIS
jgi:hypothetical protein